jgi:hypothetical protein
MNIYRKQPSLMSTPGRLRCKSTDAWFVCPELLYLEIRPCDSPVTSLIRLGNLRAGKTHQRAQPHEYALRARTLWNLEVNGQARLRGA